MPSNRYTVTKAIRSLGLRVTAADVAATTGLPLHQTIRELNKIAADAHAVMQVSKTGTLAYAFRGDPDAVYAAKGVQKAINATIAKVKGAFYFAVRCSFGVLLIGSIVTLLVIFIISIAFALFAADSADGHMDLLHEIDGGDGDLDWDFFDLANLAMFFSWWHRDMPYQQQSTNYYGQYIGVRETGFISNCFSFLFGDGDPNKNYIEDAWRHIADLIRLNNGVITAAQVAPYVEDFGTDQGIFPVLVRFDGIPQVTNTGNICYTFPSMQSTAAGHVFRGVPKFLSLKEWKFSEVPGGKLTFVFYFAGANLAGWWCVHSNLHHFEFLMKYQWMVALLVLYAVFFIAFPMGREVVNQVRNAFIEVRNKQRERAALALAQPKAQAVIREAQAFATAMQWHDPSQLVYTTAESLMDQELDVLPPLPKSPSSVLKGTNG